MEKATRETKAMLAYQKEKDEKHKKEMEFLRFYEGMGDIVGT